MTWWENIEFFFLSYARACGDFDADGIRLLESSAYYGCAGRLTCDLPCSD